MGNSKLILLIGLLLLGTLIFIPEVPAPPSCSVICTDYGYASGVCQFDDGGNSCDGGCDIDGCNAGSNIFCEEWEGCYCYGTCAECSVDGDCGFTEYCNSGSCDPVSCPAVCEYVDNHACGDYNSGVPCPGGECDGNGNCVECLSDNDCSASEYCSGNSCVAVSCAGECNYVSNHACYNYGAGTGCSTGVCDGAGTCIDCLGDSDCSGSQYCDDDACLELSCGTCRSGSNHICVNDASGTACAGGVCNGAGTCVDCLGDSDCSSSQYCSGGSCAAVSCPGICEYVSNHACSYYSSATVCDAPFTTNTLCWGNDEYNSHIDRYCSGSSSSCSGGYGPGWIQDSLYQSCGTTSNSGGQYCSGGDVMQDETQRGCASNDCFSNLVSNLVQDCGVDSNSGGLYCSGGDVMQNINDRGCSGSSCYSNVVATLDEDCGVDTNSGGLYCSGDNVMQNINDRGCSGSSCYSNVVATLSQDCSATGDVCSSGSCVECTSNSDCSGSEYCSGNSCVAVSCPGICEYATNHACSYYSSATVCDTSYSTGCYSDDVYNEERDRFCPGSGSSCTGSYGSWASTTLVTDCGVDSTGSPYCSGTDVKQETTDRGCSGSSCFSSTTYPTIQSCSATGDVCSSGSCVECTVSADCSSGQYCTGGTLVCTDLPTCAEANSGTGYNTQESTEDLWGDCSSSYNSCSNQYTRTGPDGLCTGGAYSCKTSGLSTTVTTGDVCQGGSSVNPSSSTNCGTGAQACSCDTTIDCNDNSCGATKYYEGFSGASCTTTGRVSYGTWSASSGYSISGSSDATGTTCAQNIDYCSTTDICYSYGSYYASQSCNGAGSCNIGYGSTVEPDSLLASCECEVAGTQSTCTDGETDCWVNANSECCGDDNLADDWITTGGGCIDGTWKDGAECLNDGDCAGGETCDLGTNLCVLACPTLGPDKFIIQNSTGSTCFEVDTSGNSLIYGVLTQSCSTIPPVDSIILKSSGTVYGWISDNNCAMCVYGTAAASQVISYSAPAGFYVKNTNGTYVMKWDNTGGLNFAGNVCYNSGAWTGL